jgi:hypothetical protein
VEFLGACSLENLNGAINSDSVMDTGQRLLILPWVPLDL